MPEHLIGAVVERAPGPRYFESLRFAEIAPRRPLPKPAVLARWRAAAPEIARFTLRPPAETWRAASGPFRDAPGKSEGAQWIARSHDSLAADAIVLVTGTDLSPGPRDRERLTAWVEHLAARGKRRVVWHPGGLWDAEDAAEFATSIGAICGFDPLESAAPAGEIAYGRVRAIGARSRLGEGLLATIADVISAAEASTVYLALESELAVRKAKRLQELLAESGEEGGGAVLRRTGGIVVELGDDLEDEDELDEELDEEGEDDEGDEGDDDDDDDEDDEDDEDE